MSIAGQECCESRLRKIKFTLEAQGGKPFTCPFNGLVVDESTNTVSAIYSSEYPQKLQSLNEGMSYVQALRATLALKGTVLEMAGRIFQTPESFKNFFARVEAGEWEPLLCCMCIQLDGKGIVSALWRSQYVDPNSAWPAPGGRERYRIPLNASSRLKDK